MNWIVRTLIVALGIYVVSFGLDLLYARDLTAVLIGGLLLAALNTLVRPILFLVTLPLNLFTLGAFTLLLNALMLGLAAWLTPGLETTGFWRTVLAALLISLVSFLVNGFVAAGRAADRRM